MDIATMQRRIGLIEKYKEEIKIAKEALKLELESDATYQEAARKAKEAASVKKQAKDQIWGTHTNRKLLDDILTNTQEINTLEEILSDELMDYAQAHQTDQITNERGEPIKFKLMVKLLPKKVF